MLAICRTLPLLVVAVVAAAVAARRALAAARGGRGGPAGLLGGGRSPAEGMMSPPYFCYVCYDDLHLEVRHG